MVIAGIPSQSFWVSLNSRRFSNRSSCPVKKWTEMSGLRSRDSLAERGTASGSICANIPWKG